MTKRAINNIIESYVRNDASEEVRMAFDKWLTDRESHAEKDEAMNSIWEEMPLTFAPVADDPFSIIEEAKKIENIESQKSSRRKTVWLWAVSVAAACMAVFAFIGWNRPEYNETCLVSSVTSKGEFVLPDGEEGVMIARPGAMEGCSVYDGDIAALKYTSDGVDVCLSKYTDASRTYVSGGYLWYRKTKNGWFCVDGIKLHGASSLKLTYSQSISKSKIKAEYSVDGGTTWTELIATDTQSDCHEKKFAVPEGSEGIALRFTENGGTVHVCIDNIKLVEIQ